MEDPGPRPDDYLVVHVRNGMVEIQQVTHYINHGGVWTAAGGPYYEAMPLPGKQYSQFVCLPMPKSNPDAKHRKVMKHGSR